MTKLDDYRANLETQFPGVYTKRSDAELLNGLYSNHYASKMSRLEFEDAMGVSPPSTMGKVGQALSDSASIMADTATRGYLDKGLDTIKGSDEEAAKTAGARDRASWLGMPLDVLAATRSMPYDIASTVGGAGYGAAEGLADTYGHQKNWIPRDYNDYAQLFASAMRGGAAGAAGAKGGAWLGDMYSRYKSKANQLFKNDAELKQGVHDVMAVDPYDPESLALLAQQKRLDAARNAQAQGRDAFGNLKAGNAAERDAIAAIVNKTPTRAAVGEALQTGGRIISGRGKSIIGSEIANTANEWLGGIPRRIGQATEGAGKLVSAFPGKANSVVGDKEFERLATIIRDPTGRGIRTDPAAVDAARQMLAKMGIGADKGATYPGAGPFSR